MANIIDATAAINIGIIPQGFCAINNLTANPNPCNAGTNVTITLSASNTGSIDTLWADFYANGTLFNSVTSASPVGPGSAWPVTTTRVINVATIILVNAGHMVGTTKVQDSTRSLSITLIAQGLAELVNVVVNPTTVEPGGTATISYSVINNGGTDTLWGGLYDAPSPGGALVTGTAWGPIKVEAGATYTPAAIQITNITNPIVNWELRVGHEE
jgi:hypothetical protein